MMYCSGETRSIEWSGFPRSQFLVPDKNLPQCRVLRPSGCRSSRQLIGIGWPPVLLLLLGKWVMGMPLAQRRRKNCNRLLDPPATALYQSGLNLISRGMS